MPVFILFIKIKSEEKLLLYGLPEKSAQIRACSSQKVLKNTAFPEHTCVTDRTNLIEGT